MSQPGDADGADESQVRPTLITSDCHIAAPFEITSDLSERYRDYFPHVDRRPEGVFAVNPARIGGSGMTLWSKMSRPLEEDPVDRARAANTGVPESRAGYDAASLLADLERDSVSGAVLINV